MSTPLQRHARSFWVSVLASVLVLSQLAGSLHMALERHRVCAEHGDFTHADEAPTAHALSHRHAHDEATPHASQIDPLAQSGEASAHEHCACFLLVRERFAELEPDPFVSIALAQRGAASAWKLEAPAPAIPVFLLAPKHSPPNSSGC